MSFWWQKADFDALTNEPTYQQFEDLRTRLWLLEFVSSITQVQDDPEDEGLTAATWAAYVDSIPSGDFPLYAGEPEIKMLKFEGEYYHCNSTTGIAKATLTNNPPTNAEGVLNTFWNYAACPWRLQDWNRNSRRYIAEYSSVSVSSVLYRSSICQPAWRWMMRQTDPRRQRDFIRYEEGEVGEREMPHRLPVEYARQYITKSTSLGPVFNETVVDKSGIATVTKVATKGDSPAVSKETGLFGRQYTVQGSQPEVSADIYQWFYNPKCNSALQNQIERLSASSWAWIVDTATDQGAQFKKNLENYFKQLANKDMSYTISAWSSGGSYTTGDIVTDKLDNMQENYFRWTGNEGDGNTADQPLVAGSYYWAVLGHLPRMALMHDDLWGCNGSAFELALWLLGKYDWYFEPSFTYIPWYLLLLEDDNSDFTPYLRHGSWRRTWRRTMGGPKTALDNNRMWPKSKGTPSGADYFTYSGKQYPYYSLYSATSPTITLTEEEQTDIDKRHKASAGKDVLGYELSAVLVKDAWDILDYFVHLQYDGPTAELDFRQGQTASPPPTATTRQAAYDAGVASAIANVGAWNNNQSTVTAGIRGTSSGAGTSWTGEAVYYLCRIRIPLSSWPTWMQTLVKSVGVLLEFNPYFDDIGGSEDYAIVNGEYLLPDGTTGSVPNFEGLSDNPLSKWKDMHFLSLPISSSNETDSVGDLTFPVVKTNQDEPVTVGNSSSTNVVAFSRIIIKQPTRKFEPSGVILTLDFNQAPASLINDTNYKQFTEVATDPGKFDNDGYLKPENEWP